MEIAKRGVATRPALEVFALLLGAVAALLPFRYGLSLAIVLSTLDGFLADFAGNRAVYWNEVFITVLVARSLFARLPSRRDLIVAVAVAAVYIGYLATGTRPAAVFWGAKVLVTSVVAGWALARSKLGHKEWRGIFFGLAFAAGANFVLAAWQHAEGAKKLQKLGISYDERLKETPAHVLRVFGGFTSAAPFAYALVFTLFVWIAFVTGSNAERRVALFVAWVPAVAVVGIAWASDRTALFGLAAALVVVALRQRTRTGAGLLVGVAIVVAAVVGLSSASARSRLQQGLDLQSSSAQGRSALWRAYLAKSSLFGNGPASAGSAYKKTWGGPAAPLPLTFGPGWWLAQYTRQAAPYRWNIGESFLALRASTALRPALRLSALARAFRVPKTLFVSLHGRRLTTWHVSQTRETRVSVRVPTGRGAAVLKILTYSPSSVEPESHRALAVRFRSFRIEGLPPPRTPAEGIYDRQIDERAPPGTVDSLYVSWIFQYGVLGGALCLVWLGVLLWPLFRRSDHGSPMLAMRLVGVFLVVGAIAVNIWEEAPTDLLAAMVFACALAGARRGDMRTPFRTRA